MTRPIGSIEEFYAHAIDIEREAVQRYSEFEAWFRERGEDVLASLCSTLARTEIAHFRTLVEASRHLALKPIATGQHAWLRAGSPEAPARELFYRVAAPRHLLELALQAESNAVAFFDWVANTSADEGIRQLALEMAAEEREHVRWVRHALEYHVTTREPWVEGLAPANRPG
jgi:rubrerythrin